MGILLLIILIIIVIGIFRPQYTPENKGAIGESIVSGILHRLRADDYMVINDLIIMNNHGSSQIDHVVICPFGIIVIETKCYKGWIFGSEEGENWTQALYQEKFKFYNPILQNRGHVKTLKYHLTKYYEVPYYSIIVMAGSCEFKTFDKVVTPVVYPASLYNTIINLRGEEVLHNSDIVNIGNILNNISYKDRESQIEHIRDVNIRKWESNNDEKTGKCPRCKGQLVERKGKYGKFLGCSNYPKCKFTKKPCS